VSEPTGVICLFTNSDTCPSGWTRYDDINDDGTGVYWFVGASPDTTVTGSNTHTHPGIGSHTHTIPSGGSTGYYDDSYGVDLCGPVDTYYLYSPPHNHPISGETGDNTSASVNSSNHAPPRAQFVLCRKD